VVEAMTEYVKFPDFVQLSILKDYGNKLDTQNHKVDCDTEGHLYQHGMNIGMPENEPPANGLTNVNPKHAQCAGIANKAYDHSGIDNIFQFTFSNNIGQEACEKSARPKGNNREIKDNPEGEGEYIAHVGLIQPFPQTKKGR
jgi:hypothetical protein